MAVAHSPSKSEPKLEEQPEDPELLIMLEKRILEMCHSNPKGITERHLKEDQPELTPTIRMKIINKMLASGEIELCKQGSNLVYRKKEVVPLDSGLSAGLSSLEPEPLLVYHSLEGAKRMGMISTDIRRRTNLPQTQVTRILKQLESQGLAKTVKLPDVTGAKSKVYLLTNFDPDPSLLNRERLLTKEEIDQLFSHTLKLLLAERAENSRFFSSEELIGLSVGLSFTVNRNKIELVLQALADEGKLETDAMLLPSDEMEEKKVVLKFRAVGINISRQLPSGVSLVPCVMCHLIDKCQDIGNISPNTCLYLKEWLTF